MEKKRNAGDISRRYAKQHENLKKSPRGTRAVSGLHVEPAEKKARKKIPKVTPAAEKPAVLVEPAAVQNRALSIRQPFAEMIMRGTKKIEYRSMRTNIRGRVYVYASLQPSMDGFEKIGEAPGEGFPTGVLVGTVEVVDCIGSDSEYEWHLARPERLAEPVKPQRHPQPAWFIPFEEKG